MPRQTAGRFLLVAVAEAALIVAVFAGIAAYALTGAPPVGDRPMPDPRLMEWPR